MVEIRVTVSVTVCVVRDDETKGECETRCRLIASSSRKAPRGLPGLTSPSDGRIAINSTICLLNIYYTAEGFGILSRTVRYNLVIRKCNLHPSLPQGWKFSNENLIRRRGSNPGPAEPKADMLRSELSGLKFTFEFFHVIFMWKFETNFELLVPLRSKCKGDAPSPLHFNFALEYAWERPRKENTFGIKWKISSAC